MAKCVALHLGVSGFRLDRYLSTVLLRASSCLIDCGVEFVFDQALVADRSVVKCPGFVSWAFALVSVFFGVLAIRQ